MMKLFGKRCALTHGIPCNNNRSFAALYKGHTGEVTGNDGTAVTVKFDGVPNEEILNPRSIAVPAANWYPN